MDAVACQEILKFNYLIRNLQRPWIWKKHWILRHPHHPFFACQHHHSASLGYLRRYHQCDSGLPDHPGCGWMCLLRMAFTIEPYYSKFCCTLLSGPPQRASSTPPALADYTSGSGLPALPTVGHNSPSSNLEQLMTSCLNSSVTLSSLKITLSSKPIYKAYKQLKGEI